MGNKRMEYSLVISTLCCISVLSGLIVWVKPYPNTEITGYEITCDSNVYCFNTFSIISLCVFFLLCIINIIALWLKKNKNLILKMPLISLLLFTIIESYYSVKSASRLNNVFSQNYSSPFFIQTLQLGYYVALGAGIILFVLNTDKLRDKI